MSVTDRGAAVWEYSAETPIYTPATATSAGGMTHPSYFHTPSFLAPPIAYPREFTSSNGSHDFMGSALGGYNTTNSTSNGLGGMNNNSSSVQHNNHAHQPLAFQQSLREPSFGQIYREVRDSNTSAGYYHLGWGSIGDFRKVYSMKCSNNDGVFSASNVLVSSYDSIGQHHLSPGVLTAPNHAALYGSGGVYGSAQGGGGSGGMGGGGLGGGGMGGGISGGGVGGGVGGSSSMNSNAGGGGGGSGGTGGGLGHASSSIRYGVVERDSSSNTGVFAASRACTALYCLSSHRLHAGILPNLDNSGGSSSGSIARAMHSITKEVGDD